MTKKYVKPKYAYTTKNNLSVLINIRKSEKVLEEGRKVLIRDIEEELAAFCEVSRDTILMLKRGVNQPSLALALKLAEYFKVPVEEIFTIMPNEELKEYNV